MAENSVEPAEPWFEPDFWSGSPRFGPWFLRQPEPDRKTVLGSRSSQMVQFWFGLPEPFRTLIDFDFDNTCLDVRLSSSGFTLLINQATFSLFEGIPEVLFIEDRLQHCARLPFTGGGYVRRGQGGFWRDCVLRYAAEVRICALNADGSLEGQHPSLPAHNPSHATPPAPMLMPATSLHPLSLACCSCRLAFAGSLAVSHSPTVSHPLSLTRCLSPRWTRPTR
ncbi:uncharacterized protein F5147DRAFT_842342 [Suillus discolor]|uniref:Uncharacterized protein n=1 Tax=Suillus discolor TaxID=1912936 RepID=A0A9P7ER19_9AGAM|nr:uncharacterized protein F5147DRAFT_842342 [Suillus discolor]KAG2081797.1 hypothetical protein F5147DRAFT_842342 [Suillus discolor]